MAYQVKHAPVITPEEEEKLWDSGAIGIYSPQALGRCVLLRGQIVLPAWRRRAPKSQASSNEALILIAIPTLKTVRRTIRVTLGLETSRTKL